MTKKQKCSIVHCEFKFLLKMFLVNRILEGWRILLACHAPQIREQMSGSDLHVFTLKFLALNKTGFSPIKNTFQIFFDFCLPLFYATFQCGP